MRKQNRPRLASLAHAELRPAIAGADTAPPPPSAPPSSHSTPNQTGGTSGLYAK